MILRWLRESVRWKPWRPFVQGVLGVWFGCVGFCGNTILRCCRALRGLPQPNFDPARISQAIVLRPDRLGDVMLMLPMLPVLRAWLPKAKLTVVVAERLRCLLEGLDAIDELVAVSGDGLSDWWKHRASLNGLRGKPGVCIIAAQPTWPVGLMARWLGGLFRIGYARHGMEWLFTHPVGYPYMKTKAHQVTVNLGLLKALGCPVPEKAVHPGVSVSAEAEETARKWRQEHELVQNRMTVMVHPGTRSRYTRWDTGRFGEVVRWLHDEAKVQVIVLCGPGEEDLIYTLKRSLSFALAVARGLDLPSVAALMRSCQLFVGNATGTAHLAAALGVRTVMIIGGTHPQDCPERWHPYGEGHAVVHKKPSEAIGHDTEAWLGYEGLKWIMPFDVISTLRSLLSSQTPA